MTGHFEKETSLDLVLRPATLLGESGQDAPKLALQSELDRAAAAIPLRERLAALRAAHPLPPATGEATNKAFFDELSGGL